MPRHACSRVTHVLGDIENGNHMTNHNNGEKQAIIVDTGNVNKTIRTACKKHNALYIVSTTSHDKLLPQTTASTPFCLVLVKNVSSMLFPWGGKIQSQKLQNQFHHDIFNTTILLCLPIILYEATLEQFCFSFGDQHVLPCYILIYQ